MSKSIYDEALEIINILPREGGKVNKTKIIKALLQAQKQEELLELYKEINNKRKELMTLARHNTWSWKLECEITILKTKIKELENENTNDTKLYK